MQRERIWWIALAIVLMAAPVQAQYGAFDMGALTNTLALDHVTRSEGARPAASGASIPKTLLTFAPSEELRTRNLADFIAQTRARDAEAGNALQQLLATNDVINAAEGYLQPYGMSASNVADAISLYLSTAWLAIHGSIADPDKSAMHSVRDQLAAAIGATPAFRQASDADKQQLAEAMIVQSAMISQFVLSAQNDPEQMRRVQEAVGETVMSQFGLNLAALNMTPEGLR
ncbi:hypothetical protein FF80_00370 [Devosia sp. LC5]|nr:hypothetical protein FF80_00370 [Devosia sp. LC5]